MLARDPLARLALLVRLLETAGLPALPTRGALQRELDLVRERDLVHALASLVDQHLAAVASSAADRVGEADGEGHQECWSMLEEGRRAGLRVPCVPAPAEGPLEVGQRLIEGARALGAREAWVGSRMKRLERLRLGARAGARAGAGESTEARAEEARRILAAIGGALPGRTLAVFDTDAGLECIEDVGAPVDWRNFAAPLRRASFEGGPTEFVVRDEERLRRGWSFPIVLEGRTHGLVVLVSTRRGDEGGWASAMLARARTQDVALGWRAAQFRSWHRIAHGWDPWFDPRALGWRDRALELVRMARSGVRIEVDGPSREAEVARRWLRFERGGAGAGASDGSPVRFEVPGLRDRRDELVPLLRRWLVRLAAPERPPQLEEAALGLLWRQEWPGGGVALGRCLARAWRFAAGGQGGRPEKLSVRDVRRALRERGLEPVDRLPSRSPRRIDLLFALESTRHRNGNWNRARAASILGWDTVTLAARMGEAGMDAKGKGKKVGGASCVPR
ncbi:MAG TPA: hypothetical protein ENJ09_06360 [Planctomycetes bacterium]|nr:hypothetical protein [Planctomycetota bacterium]